MKKFEHALNLSDLPLTKIEPVEFAKIAPGDRRWLECPPSHVQHIHDEFIEVEAEEVVPRFKVSIEYLRTHSPYAPQDLSFPNV